MGDQNYDGRSIKNFLHTDGTLREQYLLLYEIVQQVTDLTQQYAANLATTTRMSHDNSLVSCLKYITAHYARYFKPNPNETIDPSEPAVVFNWTDIRTATLSFLDSIIIELCFPDSPYPKSVLFQILHDAVEESPREAKRFSQALWDAIGDLSVRHCPSK